MKQNTPRRGQDHKRPQHPLITFLWALIVALLVINVMMIIKLTANTADHTESTALYLSSLDNISVEL